MGILFRILAGIPVVPTLIGVPLGGTEFKLVELGSNVTLAICGALQV